MGCAQSTETNYYFGFLNVNISHMDLFSFILGICVTVGMLYLIRCVRTNRKIHKHILGGHQWASYPMQPMATSYPTSPTAPYQNSNTKTSPVAIPWQISWNSRNLHIVLYTAFQNRLAQLQIYKPDDTRNFGHVCNLHAWCATYKNFFDDFGLWYLFWHLWKFMYWLARSYYTIFDLILYYSDLIIFFGSDSYISLYLCDINHTCALSRIAMLSYV